MTLAFSLRPLLAGILPAVLALFASGQVSAAGLGASDTASLEDAVKALKERYAVEVQMAQNRATTGNRDYWLLFTEAGGTSPREYLGNALAALSPNREALEKLTTRLAQAPVPAAEPMNDPFVRGALSLIERNLAKGCRHCKTREDWQAYRKLAREYVSSFDIRGATTRYNSAGGFSGLPFYASTRAHLSDPVFIARTKELHRVLADLIVSASRKPPRPIDDNLFAIATRVCNGDRGEAIELVGTLLSRDVNFRRFFEFVPVADLDLVRKSGTIPALVRVIAELDKVARNSNLDRFSYDGRYATKNIKNYYFWGAALNAEKLTSLSPHASPRSLIELSAGWARQYKLFRGVERYFDQAKLRLFGRHGGPVVADITDARFAADGREVMRNSAEGADFALRQRHSPGCSAALRALFGHPAP